MSNTTAGRKAKVLYIVGPTRSGSTILGRVLGQLKNAYFVGELSNIWRNAFIHDRLCGCGTLLRECEFWQEVLREAYGERAAVDYQTMARRKAAVYHPRHYGCVARAAKSLESGDNRKAIAARCQSFVDYGNAMSALYQGIQSVTGCEIIVDSSKNALNAYLLGSLPAVDMYFIHLVRDPRAVAYSRLRGKFDPARGAPLPTVPPIWTQFVWNVWHVIGELLLRRRNRSGGYIRIRYEDFITQPKETFSRVAEFVQAGDGRLSLTEDNKIPLAVSHSSGGNPGRFEEGAVELRLDARWKTSMRKRDKLLVTLLTWPLLLRYRYPIFTRR